MYEIHTMNFYPLAIYDFQIAQLCDNLIQCPNKEDEHKYCDTSSACEAAHCLYGCKHSPLGEALCFCPIGQEHDGKGCIGTSILRQF